MFGCVREGIYTPCYNFQPTEPMEETETMEATSDLETGIEDATVEWIDATRQNERAGVAIITGIGEESNGKVPVRFDLPHGEQSFTEEFRVGSSGRKSIERLLTTTDLDPATDSVSDLDGREVPVEHDYGRWSVDLEPTKRLTMDDETLVRAGGVAQLAGLVGLGWSIVMAIAMLVGGLTPLAGVPLLLAGVACRVLGEAAFLTLQAESDAPLPSDLHGYRRYVHGDPSILGLAFHLFTGGRLLD